jgi:putative acetyltransferase
LEQHSDVGDEPSRSVLQEAVHVAEDWFNMRRLQTTVSCKDLMQIALFESLGFEHEARLRQSVRVAGELVDEIVLARLSGDAARQTPPTVPAPTPAIDRSRAQLHVTIRGGSIDDWEAQHAIWSQPEVIWGTLQMPYPSADWNRQRIQERAPARFWPLMAEADGKVVGVTGLQWDEHNRVHAGHIGMMVHAEYQGMGVGSELLQAAIELAENWLGMTRLQLEVFTDNARATRLYTRHGFEVEGMHHAHSYRDGQYADTLVMGRLRQR